MEEKIIIEFLKWYEEEVNGWPIPYEYANKFLHQYKSKEQKTSEIYTCKLEGGKKKCSYKHKDYMACVQLRKCEFAEVTV